jgi:regulator of replication initiation timing
VCVVCGGQKVQSHDQLQELIAELAALRERAKAVCEETTRLRLDQRQILERVRAQMEVIRALRAESRRLL